MTEKQKPLSGYSVLNRLKKMHFPHFSKPTKYPLRGSNLSVVQSAMILL
jgi:hypothetical protein